MTQQQELRRQANQLLRAAGFWQNQDPRQTAFERRGIILTPAGGAVRTGIIVRRRPC